MKNYKNTLVAGGAGLLLGLGSMSAFAGVVPTNQGSTGAGKVAESLTGVCKGVIADGTSVVKAFNSALNSDWSYENQSTLSNGTSSLTAIKDLVAGNITEATSTIGCGAAVCSVQQFGATGGLSITVSTTTSTTYAGANNNELFLMCTIGSVGDSCVPSAIEDMRLFYFPTNNADYSTPANFEVGLLPPSSTNLNEDDIDDIIAYFGSSDKCNSDRIKKMPGATGTLVSGSAIQAP